MARLIEAPDEVARHAAVDVAREVRVREAPEGVDGRASVRARELGGAQALEVAGGLALEVKAGRRTGMPPVKVEHVVIKLEVTKAPHDLARPPQCLANLTLSHVLAPPVLRSRPTPPVLARAARARTARAESNAEQPPLTRRSIPPMGPRRSGESRQIGHQEVTNHPEENVSRD